MQHRISEHETDSGMVEGGQKSGRSDVNQTNGDTDWIVQPAMQHMLTLTMSKPATVLHVRRDEWTGNTNDIRTKEEETQ